MKLRTPPPVTTFPTASLSPLKTAHLLQMYQSMAAILIQTTVMLSIPFVQNCFTFLAIWSFGFVGFIYLFTYLLTYFAPDKKLDCFISICINSSIGIFIEIKSIDSFLVAWSFSQNQCFQSMSMGYISVF